MVTPDGIVPADVRIRDGRIIRRDGLDARTAVPRGPRSAGPNGTTARVSPAGNGSDLRQFPGDISLPTTRCCCPAWSTPTSTSTSRAGRDWEGFATATRAAAAGGVTTLIDMPLNSIPPTTDVAALDAKRQAAAGQCAVDVGFWGGAVPANAADRPALHEAGVFGFKCFLVDSGVPEFPPLDGAGLEAAMRQVAELGSLLIVHAEDAAMISAAQGSAGRGLRRLPAVQAARGRGRGDRDGDRGWPA